MKINLTCVLLATLVLFGCGAQPDLATREMAGESSDGKEIATASPIEGGDALGTSSRDVSTGNESGARVEAMPDGVPATDAGDSLAEPSIAASPLRVPKPKRAARSRENSAASASAPTMAPSPALEVVADVELPRTTLDPMLSPIPAPIPAPMAMKGESARTLPAGAQHDSERGLATIQVYYATDRLRGQIALSDYDVVGNRKAIMVLGSLCLLFFSFALINLIRRRSQLGLVWAGLGSASAAGIFFVWSTGGAGIEKRGVTYTADRGELVRGICEVTVPDSHQRGMVERPSLLRFEVSEDQSKHLVLTSATELDVGQFQRRLAETVSESPDQDMLVFVHGYNVDFQSAVARTAQIAVDLPFEGVPICYSWPSQAKLLGYTIDETNAAWTQSHLKQFLLELVQLGGARSINVVAHSMGNRPTTGAIVDLNREQLLSKTDSKLAKLDRLVLAAPDVDADRFRRDLATALSDAAEHVTLYASSDDQALIASKKVHGHPRAGESGPNVLVVPGIETVDVSGIDLSLLGHSYYGDNDSMLKDLYAVVRRRLFAKDRPSLRPLPYGQMTYWQLMKPGPRVSAERGNLR